MSFSQGIPDRLKVIENEALIAKRLEKGGGGGDSGGMDLSTRVDRIEGRLEKLDERLRGVEVGVGEIKGKIDGLAGQISQLERTTGQMISKLPSWWQMPTIVLATGSLVAVAIGLAKKAGLL